MIRKSKSLQCNTTSSTSSGFTLIELMIVIAIIAAVDFY
jgi:prepilin-type N-terminal cleavage/methylation domain-containing protein